MFDWIPLEYYSSIYYNALLFLCIMILLATTSQNESSVRLWSTYGHIFLIAIILFIGLRPISGLWFGDMGTYAKIYQVMSEGGTDVTLEKDYAFYYFTLMCVSIMPVESFFLLVTIIYILPHYFFSKKYFKEYWFFAFVAFVGSFSFYSYGTNGIRNGMATAIFIWGLCYYQRKWIMYLLFGIAFLFHSSLIIAIAAFFVSGISKKPKLYIYIWLLCIPLSLAGGSVWASLFGQLGFEDRTAGYLTNDEAPEGEFSSTGFRWDFLFYSSSAIIAGYYFIFVKKLNDVFYIHLYGIYTIANAFWILVITASYSNRFAYLSWFLMAPVITYPILKYKVWKDQYKIGMIILAYFMFTYILNVVL